MKTAMRSLFSVAVLVAAAIGLVACGGGSGGGNGGGGGAFLQLMTQPSFGVMGTVNTTTPFNVSTASAVSQVGPSNFASAALADTNFLVLNFNSTVSETSLLGGGLTVRNSNGDVVSTFLDKAGAIDPANAFMGDEAPALLRVYFQDAMNPGVPMRLAPDGYSVQINPTVLKSGTGQAFCTLQEGGGCASQANVVYSFTIDGQTSPTPGTPTAFALDPSSLPLPLPQTQGINTGSEIRVIFNREVDFQSIVGFNPATNRVNTTSQDPFCSVPFTMGGAGAGENFLVTYTPPANTFLPPNYGYIIYMPNPFYDAREVRIRFIDITLVTPFDDPQGMLSPNGLPTSQNYSNSSTVWVNAPPGTPFGIPTDLSGMNNGALELPPVLPLPGSTPGMAIPDAAITVQFLGAMNGTDSSAGTPTPDGIAGVTDRGRRPLNDPTMMGGNLAFGRSLQTGPLLANNPEPPDLHLVPNGNVLRGYDAVGNGLNGGAGGIVVGDLFPLLRPLDDPATLQQPVDALFGGFVNPANNLANPPRRLNPPQVIAQAKAAIASGMPELAVGPGTPFPPGGTPETDFQGNMPGAPAQPLGARLYVVDASDNTVKVFNSNTFQPLATIPGLATPRGLAVSGQFFYVSEFSQDTVARFGGIANTPLFHQVSGRTATGSGPTSITVQPAAEDILTVCELDRSLSFIDLPSFTERFQISTGMGPSEVVCTGRDMGTAAYRAYVTNTFSDTVTIYESDSPALTVPNGPEGKPLDNATGFAGPVNGCWTLASGAGNFVGTEGMLVPNSQGTSVSYLGFTFVNLAPPPGFPGPPPIRRFTNLIDYQGATLIGGPSDVCFDASYVQLAGSTNSIHAIFPGTGQVSSFTLTTGILAGSANVPGNQIFSAFDQ